MTKVDIAKKLVQEMGISQSQALEAVQVVFQCVADSLAAKQEVQIREFGTFHLIHCPPRKRMNFHTREKITVPEKYRVKFKPGTELREAMYVSPRGVSAVGVPAGEAVAQVAASEPQTIPVQAEPSSGAPV